MTCITTVERYLDATNRHDIDEMVAVTDVAFEFRTPRAVVRGHSELRQAMAEPQSLNVSFLPQRWFARGERVACFIRGDV